MAPIVPSGLPTPSPLRAGPGSPLAASALPLPTAASAAPSGVNGTPASAASDEAGLQSGPEQRAEGGVALGAPGDAAEEDPARRGSVCTCGADDQSDNVPPSARAGSLETATPTHSVELQPFQLQFWDSNIEAL